MFVIQEGLQFRITRKNEEVVASIGWKNVISMDKGPITIMQNGEPILKFKFEEIDFI
ncbi:MAG: hypothetical protein MUF77_05170 [Leptospira sp.]|nr:hypothetical protein [Leptospira sp.]